MTSPPRIKFRSTAESRRSTIASQGGGDGTAMTKNISFDIEKAKRLKKIHKDFLKQKYQQDTEEDE